jgi:leucyl/phenylalanyl-tRNA--protein transferase
MNAHLPWLEISDPFPDPALAWDSDSPAPGLLAAGADLSVMRLVNAYQSGIFPWFSHGQPILWWSPDPRMVLDVSHFRLHHSLRKTLQRFRASATCEIRIDHGFHDVISACAQKPRRGQSGTWIVPEMVAAYDALHAAGFAHSVETWVDGRLTGGLYCIGIGHAVFGESMFAHAPDASKIALAALVCLCKRQGATKIDCQQNTRHLASLGAGEIGRATFLEHLESASRMASLDWKFEPVYWTELLPPLAISA